MWSPTSQSVGCVDTESLFAVTVCRTLLIYSFAPLLNSQASRPFALSLESESHSLSERRSSVCRSDAMTGSGTVPGTGGVVPYVCTDGLPHISPARESVGVGWRGLGSPCLRRCLSPSSPPYRPGAGPMVALAA